MKITNRMMETLNENLKLALKSLDKQFEISDKNDMEGVEVALRDKVVKLIEDDQYRREYIRRIGDDLLPVLEGIKIGKRDNLPNYIPDQLEGCGRILKEMSDFVSSGFLYLLKVIRKTVEAA